MTKIEGRIENIIESYSKFIEDNGRIPKMSGDRYEVSLCSKDAALVKEFREGKLTKEQIKMLEETCPKLYIRATHNNTDINWKMEEFKEWAFINLKYPSESKDDAEEDKWYSWISNNRAKYRKGELPAEHIKLFNDFCPALLMYKNPAKEFGDWIVYDLAQNRYCEHPFGLFDLNLSREQIRWCISHGIKNLWDICMALQECKEEYLTSEKDDWSDETAELLKMCNYDKDPSKSLIFNIFKLIDPNITVNDARLLTSIFDTYLIDIMYSDNFRIEGVHNRIYACLYDLYTRRPMYITCLILRYYKDMTFDSIGDISGIGKEGVRQREVKALRLLRNKYNIIKGFREESHEIANMGGTDPLSIECLFDNGQLGIREFNVLSKSNINSITELHKFILDYGENELLKIRNLGKKSFERIMNVYHKYIDQYLYTSSTNKTKDLFIKEIVDCSAKKTIMVKIDIPDSDPRVIEMQKIIKLLSSDMFQKDEYDSEEVEDYIAEVY